MNENLVECVGQARQAQRFRDDGQEEDDHQPVDDERQHAGQRPAQLPLRRPETVARRLKQPVEPRAETEDQKAQPGREQPSHHEQDRGADEIGDEAGRPLDDLSIVAFERVDPDVVSVLPGGTFLRVHGSSHSARFVAGTPMRRSRAAFGGAEIRHSGGVADVDMMAEPTRQQSIDPRYKEVFRDGKRRLHSAAKLRRGVR